METKRSYRGLFIVLVLILGFIVFSSITDALFGWRPVHIFLGR